MPEPIINIGKNIKKLRLTYGETQQELADAIHVSASAIANYESGDREVDLQKLQAIAAHYRYPAEQLARENLSNRKMADLSFDYDTIMETCKIMLPLFCSERALEDSDFKKAYQCNLKIWEALEDGAEFEIQDIDTAIDYYTKSSEESQTMEATANLLSLSAFCYINIIADDNDIRIGKALLSTLTTGEAIEKKCISRKKKLAGYEDEEKKQISREFDEVMIELIKELKASPEWADLAYYYLALRYIIGLANSGYSHDWARTIGMEMMHSLLIFENQYARNLIRCMKFI